MNNQKSEIVTLTLPAPIPAGSVNAYFIDGETPTLIDTGFFTESSMVALQEKLSELGSGTEKIGRIMVTHGHFDHAGVALFLSSKNKMPLYAHPRSTIVHHLQPEMLERLCRFARRCGAPEDFIDTVSKTFQYVGKMADIKSEPHEVRSLTDGDHIDVNGIEFQVLETPGHSHDSICLFDSKSRTLIAGDTLLAEITPNPVLYFDPDDDKRPAPSLAQYLNSLKRLRTLDVQTVLTGHGPAITDMAGHIDQNLGFIEKRNGQMLEKLEGEPVTIYDLAKRIFGRRTHMEIFLALSEVIAYLIFFQSQNIIDIDWNADRIIVKK